MASPRSPRRRRARGVTPTRLAIVAVLALMGALYAGPIQKELRVSSELASAQRSVVRLERVQARLRHHVALLQTRAGEIQAARACGWTLPGEQPVIVTGQPSRCG